MIIECLASSSAGNCYVFKNKETTIMVEAGLDFKTMKSRLTFMGVELNDIKAVLITHKHGDHCHKGAVKELGVYAPIIAPDDTLESIDVRRKWHIKEFQPIRVGTFKITAFSVDHDVPAYGYIIKDEDTHDQVLFVNDTKYLKYNFSKYTFSTVMIECNHMLEKVDLSDVKARRQIEAHLSLDATVKALKSLNLNTVTKIFLMHLSDSHSDEMQMISRVMSETGIPTYACCKNGGVV